MAKAKSKIAMSRAKKKIATSRAIGAGKKKVAAGGKKRRVARKSAALMTKSGGTRQNLKQTATGAQSIAVRKKRNLGAEIGASLKNKTPMKKKSTARKVVKTKTRKRRVTFGGGKMSPV